MRKIIIILTAIVTLSSCFKDEEYTTTLNIKSTEQLESGGYSQPLNNVVAYLFEANSGLTIESYADAEAGLATTSGGTKVSAFSSAYSVENMTTLQVDNMEEVMVLVVDTQNKIYTSTTLEIGLNLSNTYLTLEFRVWQTKDYTQGSWVFVIPVADEVDTDVDIDGSDDGGVEL